jgi:quercetin dioxygenase-like cupin family protein
MKRTETPMRKTRILAIAGVATVCGAGAAFAAHVTEVDPATVPTGFLAAHNKVEGIRISSLARAVDDGKADVFIQHARFAANQDTGWHTHPGPVFVEVVKGSLIYEDARHGMCKRITYQAGQGFFDRGHGHVHRAVAGASGAEFYPVFVLPPGSAAHIIPATAPEECTAGSDRGDDSDESDDDADDERDETKDE